MPTLPSDVLFYDAHCRLCRICREWLEGAALPLRFADANDRALARQLGVSQPERLDESMCLLRRDGRQLWGYDAVLALAETSPAAQALLPLLKAAWLRRVGDRLYYWVSSHRGCGAMPAASLPPARLAP